MRRRGGRGGDGTDRKTRLNSSAVRTVPLPFWWKIGELERSLKVLGACERGPSGSGVHIGMSWIRSHCPRQIIAD